MISLAAASAEQNQVVGDDLGAVFFLAALLVFPGGSLQASFNIEFVAFLDVLAHNLGQALPGNNVVPFGAVLPFATLVFVAFVGGQAELGDCGAAGSEFDLGVLSKITDENDFIYAFRHG